LLRGLLLRPSLLLSLRADRPDEADELAGSAATTFCVADPELATDFGRKLERSIDGKDVLVSSTQVIGHRAIQLERVE
jgi:hypothetical protein